MQLQCFPNTRFLDPDQFDAEELEEKYGELDEERVREIHSLLRCFLSVTMLT